MYILHKLIITTFVLIGMLSYATPHYSLADDNSNVADRGAGAMGRSNQIYSGNRFDAGGMDQSNRNYGDNRFNNNLNRGNMGYYNVAPVYPYGYYGSAPEAPNSQIFPDDAEANALYWSGVQQMEQGE